MKPIDQITAELSAKFAPGIVSWRVGHTNAPKTDGMVLAYFDARDVMDRLDAVVGPFNWQINHVAGEGGKITAHIGVYGMLGDDTAAWVWKSDGAGATDVEGDKGSYSDATKRAAVMWGIGRYLYDIKNVWAKIEPAGKSYKIVAAELPRLDRLVSSSTKAFTSDIAPAIPSPPSPSVTVKSPFWERASLLIGLSDKAMKDGVGKDGEWLGFAWAWWETQFLNGVAAAPSRLMLAKLQSDNQHIITKMPGNGRDRVTKACIDRAQEFTGEEE